MGTGEEDHAARILEPRPGWGAPSFASASGVEGGARLQARALTTPWHEHSFGHRVGSGVSVPDIRSDVLVIAPHGELDLGSTPTLVEQLDRAIADGAPAVLVDLCDVSFMDSTGLNGLVAARRRLQRTGTRLALACPPDGEIAKVFALTTLDRVFEVYEDRASALKALAAGPAAGGAGRRDGSGG